MGEEGVDLEGEKRQTGQTGDQMEHLNHRKSSEPHRTVLLCVLLAAAALWKNLQSEFNCFCCSTFLYCEGRLGFLGKFYLLYFSVVLFYSSMTYSKPGTKGEDPPSPPTVSG